MMNEYIYPIKQTFPVDLTTEELLEEKDELFIAVCNEEGRKYVNYAYIVTRFNIICEELRRRGEIV